MTDVAKMAECNVRSYSADRHNDRQNMTLFQRDMYLATSLYILARARKTMGKITKSLSLHAFLMAHHEGTNLDISKEIGSEQIPNSTIAALGKMPGS